MKKEDSPGVKIPPPLIYAAIFGISISVQQILPIDLTFYNTAASKIIGFLLLAICLVLLPPSLFQFFRTKNTIVTIKPANSLQTRGLYSITRNPMYTGLLCLYSSLAFLIGNWWTVIFIPLVIVIIQIYVIRREENYLSRHFGQQYIDYKKKVRRWL